MNQLERLRFAMAERQIEAILVSDVTNVGWLTGFTGSFGYAVVTPEKAIFVTDSRYTIQAQEQVSGFEVRWFANPTTLLEFLSQIIGETGVKTLAVEGASLPINTYQEWQSKFGVEVQPAQDMFAELRGVKSAEELAKIREACGIADGCFQHVLRMIQPGVSEYDIALDIEFYIRRQGAQLAFPPVVVSGERSARPHGVPSDKLLENGDFLTMDFGARVDGYNSDITRTVVVGKASEWHREIYNQLLKAQLAALDAMRPGVPAREVDAVSRRVLDEIGLAKYFGHGLGHGLGRLVHDGLRLGPSSNTLLAVGQVWTVEPGVYIEGFGGARIEDDVVVTEDGIDILTKSTKELLELPRT